MNQGFGNYIYIYIYVYPLKTDPNSQKGRIFLKKNQKPFRSLTASVFQMFVSNFLEIERTKIEFWDT